MRRNIKKRLIFVRCTRILLRCGNVVAAMPSLGVSSLDLGPLASQAASFLFGLGVWQAKPSPVLLQYSSRVVSHLRDSRSDIIGCAVVVLLYNLNF